MVFKYILLEKALQIITSTGCMIVFLGNVELKDSITISAVHYNIWNKHKVQEL